MTLPSGGGRGSVSDVFGGSGGGEGLSRSSGSMGGGGGGGGNGGSAASFLGRGAWMSIVERCRVTSAGFVSRKRAADIFVEMAGLDAPFLDPQIVHLRSSFTHGLYI